MSASFTWIGLAELKAQLRNLPRELAGEATEIVTSTAEQAASQMIRKYPTRLRRANERGTGVSLREGVEVVKIAEGQFGVRADVINRSRHAMMYEVGTHRKKRGSTRPGNVFIPIASRMRRAMYTRLGAMLTRHGFQVSGSGGR